MFGISLYVHLPYNPLSHFCFHYVPGSPFPFALTVLCECLIFHLWTVLSEVLLRWLNPAAETSLYALQILSVNFLCQLVSFCSSFLFWLTVGHTGASYSIWEWTTLIRLTLLEAVGSPTFGIRLNSFFHFNYQLFRMFRKHHFSI